MFEDIWCVGINLLYDGCYKGYQCERNVTGKKSVSQSVVSLSQSWLVRLGNSRLNQGYLEFEPAVLSTVHIGTVLIV